jgi:hypothetical protein
LVAVPAATPLTKPAELTVATAALFVDHVTVRPVRTLLPASLVVAVACVVRPGAMLAEASDTDTVETGGGELEAVTVIVALPLL